MSLTLKNIVGVTHTYCEHTGLLLTTTTEFYENKEEDVGYARELPQKIVETSQSTTSTPEKIKDVLEGCCVGGAIVFLSAGIVAILDLLFS